MTLAARRSWLILLLAIGLALWWCVRELPTNQFPPLLIAAVAAVICLLPGVQPQLAWTFDWVRQHSARRRIVWPLAIGAASALVLLLSAVARHRPLVPLIYDV